MQETPNTSPIEQWVTLPIKRWMSQATSSGIILFATTILALIIANSPMADSFHHFWEQSFGFVFNGNTYLNLSLHHWINDGLMAIFFFVVGLELKREFVGGELSNPKNALLPIAAAIGGMLFPALIYLLFNHSTEASHGWGIPMATDIAFALGVLYLLGDKIPTSLKVFLTALAIVDDLGAVLVIAFFYTSTINLPELFIGISGFLFLLLSKRLGVRSISFYIIIGIFGVWLPFLLSGVHATIAAVLVAFTIPASSKVSETTYTSIVNKLLEKFKSEPGNQAPTLTENQIHHLQNITTVTQNASTPLQRLEHQLHPIVAFIIMPLFAFANAGITFSGNILASVFTNVSLGVALGLLLGKIIGVFGLSLLLVKLKVAQLPKDISVMQLFGAGCLAAIGFTMSLFVTSLAFTNPEFAIQAKIGIFIASIFGGIIGYNVLKNNSKQ